MAYGYKELTEVELAWRDNREQVALAGRQLLRRVLNAALVQLDYEFKNGLNNGEILQLDSSKEELKKLLSKTAVKELGSGS